MNLSDFNFEFDPALIAHEPLAARDQSRLLVYGKECQIADQMFKQLADILPADSLLLVNDSRVLPSRVLGHLPTGGKVEFLLLEQLSTAENTWVCLAKPMKKLKPGLVAELPNNATATVISMPPLETEQVLPIQVQFHAKNQPWREWLEQNAFVPLPPYIQRSQAKPFAESRDKERYQTVYAGLEGSSAAPTAGLHFTDQVFASLRARGIQTAKVTLHVGPGTFLPVKASDPTQHVMHEERFVVSRQTYETVMDAKKTGRKVLAVGTTALRSWESLFQLFPSEEKRLAALDQWQRTRLFIYPTHKDFKYQTHGLDGLITNFHQPESTLFMLICALLGWHEAQRMYQHALAQRYRLFSYGDSSLLWFS